MPKIEVPFVKVSSKITVASVGNGSLLIRDNLGNCFVITNPASPGVFGHNVSVICVSEHATNTDIINAIDRHENGKSG